MVTADCPRDQLKPKVSLNAYCPFHLVELKHKRAGSALDLCSHVTAESRDGALQGREVPVIQMSTIPSRATIIIKIIW